MSQRASGYERKERDLYETPAWVTEALLPHLPEGLTEIWEPACGSGKMARALETIPGAKVIATDIETVRYSIIAPYQWLAMANGGWNAH